MPMWFFCVVLVLSPRICTNRVENKLRVFVLIVNWVKRDPDEVCVPGDFPLK